MSRRAAIYLCSLLIASTTDSVAFAGEAFFDDFDGDSPVTWSRYAPPYDLGTVEVSGGNLTLTPSNEFPRYSTAPNYFEIDLTAQDRRYHDVNVHTQFRSLEPGGSWGGIGVLDNLFTDPTQGSGIWGYLHPSGNLNITYEHNGGLQNLGRNSTGMSSVSSDIQLRLVVDGEMAHLTGWDGLVEPAPQLTVRLPASLRPQDHTGQVTLFAGSTNPLVPTAFRFVDVVPEPSSAVLGLLGCIGVVGIRRRRKTLSR